MKLSAAGFFQDPTQDVAVEPRHPQPPFPLHDHDFDEIVIVLSGSGWHEINVLQDVVAVGDVLYIRSHDHHKFYSVRNLCLVNVLYRPGLLHEADLVAEISRATDPVSGIARWQISARGLAEIHPIIEALTRESRGREAFTKAMSASLFVQLNIALLRHRAEQCQIAPDDLSVSAAVRYMRANYAVIEKTGELAETFGYSPSDFSRKFKATVGVSPHSFLTEVRVTHAMRELRVSRDSVTDIALRCGFNDSNYFSSSFASMTGVPPTKYRKIAL